MGLALEVADELAVVVAVAVVVAPAVLLAVDVEVEVAVDEPAEPENTDVVGLPVVVALPEGEQAESATTTSMVISPKATMDRSALRAVRPMAVRARMKPPEVPAMTTISQSPSGETGPGRETRGMPGLWAGVRKGFYAPLAPGGHNTKDYGLRNPSMARSP